MTLWDLKQISFCLIEIQFHSSKNLERFFKERERETLSNVISLTTFPNIKSVSRL